MYYENIALDDVDEKMYFKKDVLDEKHCILMMQMKKTCIIKTLHLMMQMKKTCIKKTAHLKMKMKKTVL